MKLAKTYIYGWIVLPFVITWPLLLSIEEVADRLVIPESRLSRGFTTSPISDYGPREYLFIFGILWLVLSVWKIDAWFEKKGLPT